MTADKSFTVAIVGGGIGGVALALGLIHNGVSVEIYEQAQKFSEIGAGVSFGDNALRALAGIAPATLRAFEENVTYNGYDNKRNVYFDFRHGIGEPELIASVSSRAVGQNSIHRADFLDAMVKMIPDSIVHFRKRVVKVEEVENKML
ncbi:hypothetical protein V1524DRAFT_177778, partial [Lipomyces starkeyi]